MMGSDWGRGKQTNTGQPSGRDQLHTQFIFRGRISICTSLNTPLLPRLVVLVKNKKATFLSLLFSCAVDVFASGGKVVLLKHPVLSWTERRSRCGKHKNADDCSKRNCTWKLQTVSWHDTVHFSPPLYDAETSFPSALFETDAQSKFAVLV